MISNKKHSGFTLIELLVVIGIISLISSIIFASVNVARVKAQNTKMAADTKSVASAIYAYYFDKGKPPPTFVCTSGTCVEGPRTGLGPEQEDIGNSINPTTEAGKAYNATMQQLVSGGYLSAVPRSPGKTGYSYSDQGAGSSQGVTFSAVLLTPTTLTSSPSNCSLPSNCGVLYQAPQDPSNAFYMCTFNYPGARDGVCRYYLSTPSGDVQYPPNGSPENEGCPTIFPATGINTYSLCMPY